MTRGRILVVEDDAPLRSLIEGELSRSGLEVAAVGTGGDALAEAALNPIDLVVLDLNLPDVDGLEVARRLKSDRDVDADILMLTARADVPSRVEGLYAGASDYLTKPFDVRELLARVHVRLRERAGADTLLRWGELTLDTAASTLCVGRRRIVLPERECALLALLLGNRGRLFSRDELERRLYGIDELPASNTIEVFVYQLRRKFARLGSPDPITTVRSKGYMVP